MRVLKRTFLFLNFVILYISLLIAVSFRFQLLDSTFWLETFRREKVYESFEKAIKPSIKSEYLKGGEIISNSILNIFTVDVIRDTTERNIVNILDFMNGQGEFKLYLPSRFSVKEEYTLSDFQKNFGIVVPQQNITYLSQVGAIATISLIVSFVFFILGLWGLYKQSLADSVGKTVDRGSRLIFPGLTLIISSILVFIIILLATIESRNIVKDLLTGEPAQVILGSVGPPVLRAIVNLWTYINLVVLICGIALLFLKKPGKVGS